MNDAASKPREKNRNNTIWDEGKKNHLGRMGEGEKQTSTLNRRERKDAEGGASS